MRKTFKSTPIVVGLLGTASPCRNESVFIKGPRCMFGLPSFCARPKGCDKYDIVGVEIEHKKMLSCISNVTSLS